MNKLLWLTLFLFLTVVLAACDAESESETDTMVDLGTHSLHIRCVGRGRPAIVIDTGHGDVAAKWHEVQDQLAAKSRVCTYDRAGYGRSEPGPLPRHSRQAASELKRLLEKGGVEGPYVLVGHSLGGLNAQVFAGAYPELVAGLVLVDPPPLGFIAPTGSQEPAFPGLRQMAVDQAAELSATAQRAQASTDPAAKGQADYLAAIASELTMFLSESAEQAAGIESFGDLPLTVVAAGRPNPAFGEQAEAFQQFWIEQSRGLAHKSTDGAFVLAAESSHQVHEDAPEQVVEAVLQVLERARREQGRG